MSAGNILFRQTLAWPLITSSGLPFKLFSTEMSFQKIPFLKPVPNAFTNASTNSYKRIIPGFEAPVLLAYSARNRSASCIIPFATGPKGKRVEVRFPDPTANPYLAFSAMLMAGLDGIQNKIHPGDPMDKNLYDLPPEELKNFTPGLSRDKETPFTPDS